MVVGRLVTLVVSGALVVLLSAVGWFLPVPYVREAPGPTYNTLGSVDGKQVVTVAGHATYPVGGHLNMTTVSVVGGPGNQPSLGQVLTGWVDPHVAVVPEELFFPTGTTQQQVEQQSSQQFRTSEDNGTVAALRYLDIAVHRHLVVQRVEDGLPADGKLQAGDRIVSVDGARTRTTEQVQRQTGKRAPGDTIRFTVKRDGKRKRVAIESVADPRNAERAIVGIFLDYDYTYPLRVSIRLQNVGGPSAGLMFSLAVVDRLTPGKLTGGRFIAGTGTITPTGRVGPIGGITQKMTAARNAGATVFLTPHGNCREATSTRPDGLRLVAVRSLADAVHALDALRMGRRVPACPQS